MGTKENKKKPIETKVWNVGLRCPTEIVGWLIGELKQNDVPQSRLVSAIVMLQLRNMEDFSAIAKIAKSPAAMEELYQETLLSLQVAEFPGIAGERFVAAPPPSPQEVKRPRPRLRLVEPEPGSSEREAAATEPPPPRPGHVMHLHGIVESEPPQVQDWMPPKEEEPPPPFDRQPKPRPANDTGLDRVRLRIRFPGDYLVSDVVDALAECSGDKQPLQEAWRERGEVLRGWQRQYVQLASEVQQLRLQAEQLNGRQKRMVAMDARGKARELKALERSIRLSERPLLKLLFEASSVG